MRESIASSKSNERIVRDPAICGGQPVFKGTRVTLRTVLASLADGDSEAEILLSFPSLQSSDIGAAIAFAAASAGTELDRLNIRQWYAELDRLNAPPLLSGSRKDPMAPRRRMLR